MNFHFSFSPPNERLVIRLLGISKSILNINFKKKETKISKENFEGRRDFLLTTAATLTIPLLSKLDAEQLLELETYQRKKIIDLKDIKSDEPFYFSYPYEDKNSFIVKLDEKAAGGIGEGHDIVAFNQYCTHMGIPLEGTYKKTEKVMGACPMHLTTFDLTRHGMVVAGHATTSLPQIQLELHNGTIYAIGITGLRYGHSCNFQKKKSK